MEYQNAELENQVVHYRVSHKSDVAALTVIFIHGFPFTSSIWDEQLSALPQSVCGIAYDIRGFGGSSSDHTFFSIDLFAKDLLKFIHFLSPQNCVLCGISMGGYIALRAFELAPQEFAGLILCDTNCVSDSNKAKLKRFDSIQKIMEGAKEEFASNFVQDVFCKNTLSEKPEVADFLRSMILNVSDSTICSALLALASRTDTSDILPSINVPTLIIRGEEDKLMSEDQTKQLAEGIKHSKVVNVPSSGHLPNLENPEGFNYAVKNFISKHFLS